MFFLVLYGIIMYGTIFAAQQSLNLAAQDGARKALQWQPGAGHLQLRADAARSTALVQADWIAAASGGPLDVAVCGGGGALSATDGASCSGASLDDDQIEVIVSFAYREHPLIPSLPFFQQAMAPAQLQARASVHLSNLAAGEGG